jgi:hypothetical protein
MGFFDFLNSVGDLFGQVASLINSLFVFLWNAMLSLFIFIWNTLVILANFLLGALRAIGKFFARFWTDYVLKGIRGLLHLWEKIRFQLQRIFGPVLRFMQRVRAWFDAHILPILLRYINLIQRIRRFLVVLRLLHIHWADALDNQLARIQGKLTAVIEVVRGTLNQIISTLALVMDPSLIIRRNVLGASLLSHLGAVKRIVGYGSNRILTADEAKQIDRNVSRYKATAVTAHVAQLAASGLTDEDKAEREAARRALVEAFGVALPF